MLLIILLNFYPKNLALIFVAGTLITTVLEYFAGWLLEKIFNTRWWDYSQNKFNFRGRICLLNSLLFGIMSVALMFFINPMTIIFTARLSAKIKYCISAVLTAYFAADFAITISSMKNLNSRLEGINRSFTAIKERLDSSDFYNALNIKERLEKLHEIYDTDMGRAITASIEGFSERIRQLELGNKLIQKRIFLAFPEIRSTKYPDILNVIKEKVTNSRNKTENEITERDEHDVRADAEKACLK
jgi:uncharacterized membrane protein